MHTQFSWMTTEELIRHYQYSEDELVRELINRVKLAEKKSIEEEERVGDKFIGEFIQLL